MCVTLIGPTRPRSRPHAMPIQTVGPFAMAASERPVDPKVFEPDPDPERRRAHNAGTGLVWLDGEQLSPETVAERLGVAACTVRTACSMKEQKKTGGDVNGHRVRWVGKREILVEGCVE